MKEEVRVVTEELDVKEKGDVRIGNVSIAGALQWLRSGSTAKREIPLYVYPFTRPHACSQNTRRVIQCATCNQSRYVNLQMEFGIETDLESDKLWKLEIHVDAQF